jgi:hypothetical protein
MAEILLRVKVPALQTVHVPGFIFQSAQSFWAENAYFPTFINLPGQSKILKNCLNFLEHPGKTFLANLFLRIRIFQVPEIFDHK